MLGGAFVLLLDVQALAATATIIAATSNLPCAQRTSSV